MSAARQVVDTVKDKATGLVGEERVAAVEGRVAAAVEAGQQAYGAAVERAGAAKEAASKLREAVDAKCGNRVRAETDRLREKAEAVRAQLTDISETAVARGRAARDAAKEKFAVDQKLQSAQALRAAAAEKVDEYHAAVNSYAQTVREMSAQASAAAESRVGDLREQVEARRATAAANVAEYRAAVEEHVAAAREAVAARAGEAREAGAARASQVKEAAGARAEEAKAMAEAVKAQAVEKAGELREKAREGKAAAAEKAGGVREKVGEKVAAVKDAAAAKFGELSETERAQAARAAMSQYLEQLDSYRTKVDEYRAAAQGKAAGKMESALCALVAARGAAVERRTELTAALRSSVEARVASARAYAADSAAQVAGKASAVASAARERAEPHVQALAQRFPILEATEKARTEAMQACSSTVQAAREYYMVSSLAATERATAAWGAGKGRLTQLRSDATSELLSLRPSAEACAAAADRQAVFEKLLAEGAERANVPAGQRFSCAYLLHDGDTLRWLFRVHDRDCGFGVAVRSVCEQASPESPALDGSAAVPAAAAAEDEFILPVESYDNAGTVEGQWVADAQRTVVLVFDNKHSLFRSKDVAYLVGVERV